MTAGSYSAGGVVARAALRLWQRPLAIARGGAMSLEARKRVKLGAVRMPDLPDSLVAKRDRLLAMLAGFGRCVVAYSGGVDSAVLACAAQRALGERALAVTAASASLATGELEAAQALATQIGIRHAVVSTNEFANPDYLRNDAQRCYHCKTELYVELEQLASRWPGAVLVNGANADDVGDHRPGMVAAGEHRVASPLLECELSKAEVRQLAAAWGLGVWDKPAAPCLSSRIAYGEAVTPERVAMVDRAEQFLRAQGLVELRVRYHAGDVARIEAPLTELSRLAEGELRAAIARTFRELGFRFITLDLDGFRPGSLNTVLPVESLRPLR